MKAPPSNRRCARLICVGLAFGALAGANATSPIRSMAAASAGAAREAAGGTTTLEVLYRSPVLVRVGERVRIPVDVVCARGGVACAATAALAVRDAGGRWRSSRAPQGEGLTFDVTAPASRAARAGRLDFRLSARGPGGEALALPERASLHLYVAPALRSVDLPAIPFGRVTAGHTVLYLPWGSGSGSAGLAPADESSTVGPSSFDVDRSGRITLVDPLHRRVAVFRDGRLIRETAAAVPPRTDLAVTPGGTAFLASDVPGPHGRAVEVRAIDPAGRLGGPVSLGSGTLAEIRTTGGSPFADLLPLDAWVPVVPGGATGAHGLFTGRPLAGGGVILGSVVGNTVRLGRVRDGRIGPAFELRFGTTVGELALAEPRGRGFVAVVHVTRSSPVPADQYQVVLVGADGSASTFAVANRAFAEPMPLSRFRMGKDGRLYQIATSPDGVRIVRYRIGG